MLDFVRQRGALQQFHHQVIRTHVVQRANMRMIQRRNRSRFSIESFAELLLRSLDGDGPPQPGINRAEHFAHTASSQVPLYLVRPKIGPLCDHGRRDFKICEPGHAGPSRLVRPSAPRGIPRQQRFHLAPKLRIGCGQHPAVLSRRAIQVFDLPDALGSHSKLSHSITAATHVVLTAEHYGTTIE